MQEENAWQGKISISFMARLLAVGIGYPGGLMKKGEGSLP